jgi:hypothetical protein
VGANQQWCELFKSEVFEICLGLFLFFFLVCGCNCLDDGVKGAENINKKQDGRKAKHETFSSSNVLYGGFCSR